MSTAAEHFAEAEQILGSLVDYDRGSKDEASLLAEAQVHATLALAATQMRSLPAIHAEAAVPG